MSDVAIKWDNEAGSADWAFGAGDLQTAPGIETALRVSYFTQRGWWGDEFNGFEIGSRLHELRRAKKQGQTGLLLAARDMCREASTWLVEQGIAAKIDVKTSWLASDALGIETTVTKPDGTKLQPFRHSYAWA